jgi:hypothetical protein
VRDALPVRHPFVHTVMHSREGRSHRLYYLSRLQPHNTHGRHAPTRALPPFHTVTRHEKRVTSIGLSHDTSPFVLTRQAVRPLTQIVHPPHHTESRFETGLYSSLNPQHSRGHTPQHITMIASHHYMYKNIKYLSYRLLVSADRRTNYERSEQNFLPAAPRLCHDKHFSPPDLYPCLAFCVLYYYTTDENDRNPRPGFGQCNTK